ncbi:MAG: hypothetical protein MJY83_00555 [Bacteroidales bacterium]|nr:hypothetical protein [Bacteroidales bacterium]
MMKKVILCALCALMGLNSLAQEYPKNELSLTYGGLSIPYVAVSVAGVLGSVITGIATDGDVVLERVGTSGTFGFQYYHNFHRHFGYGAEVIYESCSLKFTDVPPGRVNFLSVMPSMKGRWFQGDVFGMYSRVSAGLCTRVIPLLEWIDEGAPVSVQFGYHVVPVGMSIGSKQLKFIAEIGLGMGPMIGAGVVYGF